MEECKEYGYTIKFTREEKDELVKEFKWYREHIDITCTFRRFLAICILNYIRR